MQQPARIILDSRTSLIQISALSNHRRTLQANNRDFGHNMSSTSQTRVTTLAQETFRNIFSFILRPPDSETRGASASTNSSSNSTTPYENYFRHMSLMGHGCPLWIPEPNEHLHINYRKRGVAIGDVVIFTENGALDFLFNICRPSDDPINSNGLPEGFLPFSPQLFLWDKRRYQQYGEGSYLASKSISKKMDDTGPSGVVFLSSASEGAILTMPKGAYSEDLSRVSGFDAYLAANLESWYKYVNDVRGWAVEMGKLHLVTGMHKSKAWGIATFSNDREAQVRLRFKSMEDPLYDTLYSWEYDGESDCPRAGPTREQKQSLYEQLPQAEHRPYENQCLFVRTVNSALRVHKEAKKPQIASIATQNNPSRPPPGFTGHGSDGSRDLSIVQSNLSIMRHGPLPMDHPSEAINEFLLKEKPGGRIAITHDHHWISLLTEKDLVFPDKNELLERLMASYKVIEKDDVISLRSIENKAPAHTAPTSNINAVHISSSDANYESSHGKPSLLRRNPPAYGHTDIMAAAPRAYPSSSTRGFNSLDASPFSNAFRTSSPSTLSPLATGPKLHPRPQIHEPPTQGPQSYSDFGYIQSGRNIGSQSFGQQQPWLYDPSSTDPTLATSSSGVGNIVTPTHNESGVEVNLITGIDSPRQYQNYYSNDPTVQHVVEHDNVNASVGIQVEGRTDSEQHHTTRQRAGSPFGRPLYPSLDDRMVTREHPFENRAFGGRADARQENEGPRFTFGKGF